MDVLQYTERIVGEDDDGAVERDEIRGDRFVVDAHEANRQARRHFAGKSGLEEADDALLLLPGRNRRISVVSAFTGSLGHGTNGIPRQVTNGEPNMVTVGGGTPRRVHSRPKAAIARGCARKKLGSFHTRAMSSSRSSGVGAPCRVFTFISGATLLSRPYSLLVMSAISWRSLTFSIISRNCSQ